MPASTQPNRLSRSAVPLLLILAVACAPARAADPDQTRTLQHALAAEQAFEQGQGAVGVRLDPDTRAVVLYDRVLIEDDGPGISSDARWMKTDRAPTVAVAGDVRVKKILHLPRPRALQARLYVERGLTIELNGSPLDVSPNTHYPEVPVALLTQGDNQLVLSGPADKGPAVKIARRPDILLNAPDRKGRPPRTFTSDDAGRTWRPVDGEAMVRLHLVQYLPEGHVISPAVDLATPQGDRAEGALLTPGAVQSVALTPSCTTPAGTAVDLAVRTGPCPVYDDALWSPWHAVPTAGPQPDAPPRHPVPEGHRYLQWRATLKSADPTLTPALHRVVVAADVSAGPPPAWVARVKLLDAHNERIRYTSIPFAYEDPLDPRLVALRKKYKLDEVVAGAASEVEAMARLRDWVAHQWRFKAPSENYPAWDADEILSRKYGFCVQYAIVFMQCATSLGHQARFVFGNHPGAKDGSGHEVAEWWSNEHRKWVFFDVNQNWHHVDRDTGVPLSMLDVHDLIIRRYYGGRVADFAKRPREILYTDDVRTCYGPSAVPGDPPKRRQWHVKEGQFRVPSRWLHIRYMPRNNFLSQPRPVPICQGTHWDWTGFWCWEDPQTPRQWLYRNFTARRSDLAWTLNQVRFDATCDRKPGIIVVQMGTVTPYFDTFLIKTDDGAWTKAGSRFTWTLHRGRNRLEMRAANNAGVRGPVSFIEVTYDG